MIIPCRSEFKIGVAAEPERGSQTTRKERVYSGRLISTFQVELTDVPGVGPATAQKLLTAFGSMKRISLATEEAIAVIVGKSAARKVVAHLRGGVTADAETATDGEAA